MFFSLIKASKGIKDYTIVFDNWTRSLSLSLALTVEMGAKLLLLLVVVILLLLYLKMRVPLTRPNIQCIERWIHNARTNIFYDGKLFFLFNCLGFHARLAPSPFQYIYIYILLVFSNVAHAFIVYICTTSSTTMASNILRRHHTESALMFCNSVVLCALWFLRTHTHMHLWPWIDRISSR